MTAHPSDDSESSTLDLEERIDAVCMEYERLCKAGEMPALEAKLRAFSPAEQEPALRELLGLEIYYRRLRGEQPAAEEYRRRFPGQERVIDSLLERENGMGSVGSGTTSVDRRTASATVPNRLPETVGGYEILEELGRGGMGIVYKARQARLNRLVALKMILHAEYATDADLARFRTEAEAIARLQHPNIVQVHEIGDHDGTPFLSLEFCPGGSLDRKLNGTPLPAREAARLVETLARAMHAAHGKQVIHRDLKPANILLSPLPDAGEGSEVRGIGTPKISDFGLARKLDDAGQTQTGTILGTPSYVAPEQASGQSKELSPACDVYALGAILYECLTGRPPFKAATVGDTLYQVTHDEPVPPRHLQSRTPRDLETICLKCLRKEPAKRYATAAALADDLHAFLEGRPIKARPVGWLERGWRWTRRNPKGAALLGCVGLLLAVILVGGTWLIRNLQAALADSRQKERGRREQVLEALLSEARATRFSRRQGQRFHTLATIRKAVAEARELDKPPEVFDELRRLAVAALALPDSRVAREWDKSWLKGKRGLAFDPVSLGRYALGDADGTIRVCRVEDDKELARLPGLGKGQELTFGLDEQTLYLWNEADGFLKRWRVGEPEPVKVAATSSGNVERWTMSRDGSRLMLLHAEKGGTRVEIFELPDGRRCFERSLRHDHNPALTGMVAALSPDGRWLAATEGNYGTPARNRVLVFDVDRGQLVHTLVHEDNARCPVWYADSSTLAVGNCDTGTVYLWDVPSEKQFRVLRELKGGGPQLGASLSGQLLAGHSEWWQNQVLWHPYTGAPLLRMAESNASLRFSTSGGWLYGWEQTGGKVRLHVAEPSPILRTLICNPKGEALSECKHVAVHPGGRLVAGGTSHGVSLFDLCTGLKVGHLDSGETLHVRFDPSGGDLFTCGAQGLLHWPIRFGADGPEGLSIGVPHRLREKVGNGNLGFDVSQDGQVIAVPEFTRAIVLFRDGSKPPLTLSPLQDTRTLSISPDGRWVLTRTHVDSDSKVWDTRTGKLAADMKGSGNLSFSSDGRWLTNGWQRWETGTWREGPCLGNGAGQAVRAYSPDGQYYFTSKDGGPLLLVDSESGKTLVTLELPEQSQVWYAAFTPDGTRLIHSTVNDHLVCVWDLRALRRHLADLDLDWDTPPFPPAPEGERRLPLLVTEGQVDLDPEQAAAAWLKAMEFLPGESDPSSYRNRLCSELAQHEAAFARAIEMRPNDVGLWLARGRFHARKSQWEKAAAAYAKATGLPGAKDYDLHLFVEQASVRILAGDTEGYRATSTQLQDRFGQTRDPVTAYIVGRAWVLGPESGLDPLRAAQFAELALKGKLPSKGFQAAALHVLGTAQYRAGQFEEAVRRLNQSLSADLAWEGAYLNWPVLALAHHRLGNDEKARQWLDKTTRRAEQMAQDLNKEPVGFPRSVHPTDWLQLQVFLREAEGLIGRQPDKSDR